MFSLEFPRAGTVLAKEGMPQHYSFILLDGEIKGFKKLFKLESQDNEERDKEHEGILQG